MKKEQRARMLTQIQHHHIAIAKLAESLGIDSPDGAKISNKLRAIELSQHRTAEKYCNGEISEHVYDLAVERSKAAVLDILPGLKGFFVNGDPRGYALKIDDKEQKRLELEGIKIHRDWGGYGILAPEFDGN